MGLQVDASNACIPITSNLIATTPPLPSTVRGEPVRLDGQPGRINANNPILVYPSNRLVIVRFLSGETTDSNHKLKAFVYRGHTAQVTCAKFSPSGCYVASADIRGKLRVWSYDNEEHLCKLDLSSAMAGPIRDISWDGDSKRICIVGDGSKTDASSLCTRVIQFDTGVKNGDLAQHARNRASSCSFKPNRPMRIVTAGSEDSSCLFNAGPPFTRVLDGKPAEACHVRGAVHCVRYNNAGTVIASVGTDKSVCFYDGKTMELLNQMQNVHDGSIYSCSWSSNDELLLTCSADGTAKLISSNTFEVIHTWDVISLTTGKTLDVKQAIGGLQMGCAFIHGNIPVSVSLNGVITLLPMPNCSSSVSIDTIIPQTKCLVGHRSTISSLAIDYDRDTMYTSDSDGTICKWDINTATALENLQREHDSYDDTLMNKVHYGAIAGMTFVQGSLFSVGWDDKLRITKESCAIKEIVLGAQPITIVTGTNVVVISTVDGLIITQENATFSKIIPITYQALSLCVTPDDSMLFAGGDDCKIHIYKINGESIQEVNILTDCHTNPIHSLQLSNDGTKLASGDIRDVCIWDMTTYTPIIGRSRWCFHQQKITSLSWSNDDSVLASGSSDDSIYFWSVSKPLTRVHYPFSHRGGITEIKFLKKSERFILVSVGADGCVNQWDVTDNVLAKFR
jgi:WD40 repeat protein